MEAISVLFSNFSFWDILIFIIAIIDLGIFILYRVSVINLENYLGQKEGVGYLPSVNSNNAPDPRQVSKKLSSSLSISTFYTNLTSLFPMFGILGTVMSLLPMVGTENMDSNFTVALTTTAWGIFFAIIYKAVGSPLSAKLDILAGNAQTYLDYAQGYRNTHSDIS